MLARSLCALKNDPEHCKNWQSVLREANAHQETQKAEARDASRRKNQVVDKLNKDMEKFCKYARLAPRNQPQLLEALGIHVPS